MADVQLEQPIGAQRKAPVQLLAPEMITKLAPAEITEVEALQRQIECGRRRDTHGGRAEMRELRTILFATVFFWLPIVAGYMWLPRDQVQFVLTYLSIVATVVAGFGIYRLFQMRHTHTPVGYKFFYSWVFTGFLLSYALTLATIVERMDTDGAWHRSGMRHK